MSAPHRSHLSHRPVAERAVLSLLLFLGITASAGGAAFVLAQALGIDSWFPRRSSSQPSSDERQRIATSASCRALRLS